MKLRGLDLKIFCVEVIFFLKENFKKKPNKPKPSFCGILIILVTVLINVLNLLLSNSIHVSQYWSLAETSALCDL